MKADLQVVFNHFPRLARDLPRIAYQAVEETVTAIEQGYRSRVHIDLGQLVNSIESDARPLGDGAQGEVGATAEHAAYEEFGTGAKGAGSNFPGKPEVSYSGGWMGREAHPALTPAVMENQQTLARAIERRLGGWRP